MATHRTIIHLDLDAFFCAVEEQLNPDLVGKPFAVGGDANSRGVVASCSYPARMFGVRSAMPMATALRLCPDLVVVSRKMGDYSTLSKQVMKLLNTFTPLVEPISIDEAFLDMTGVAESSQQIANTLQHQIHSNFQLPVSLGVATNKLVAKIANNVGKSRVISGDYPNAITIVSPTQEAAFLAPLDVRKLWGVGPKTAETLAALDVHTIGELAQYDERILVRRFGKHGYDLSRCARGVDSRPVETDRETKSVSRETTFSKDVNDIKVLRQTMRDLSDSVGYRLRQKGLAGTTIKLKLRWADFNTLTRQITLSSPTNQDDKIFKTIMALFEENYTSNKRVRLIGVGVSGFQTVARQLSLWEAPHSEGNDDLQNTLDRIRNKFGSNAIMRGTQLDNDD